MAFSTVSPPSLVLVNNFSVLTWHCVIQIWLLRVGSSRWELHYSNWKGNYALNGWWGAVEGFRWVVVCGKEGWGSSSHHTREITILYLCPTFVPPLSPSKWSVLTCYCFSPGFPSTVGRLGRFGPLPDLHGDDDVPPGLWVALGQSRPVPPLPHRIFDPERPGSGWLSNSQVPGHGQVSVVVFQPEGVHVNG